MKATKNLSLLVVIAMLLGTAAACAAPETVEVIKEVPVEVEVTRIVEVEVPAEPVELEFWHALSSSMGEVLNGQIQEFNASQYEVRIAGVYMPWLELRQKFLAATVAGNPPPLSMVDYSHTKFFAREGAYEPITNWASEEDMQDFIPALLDDSTYEGQVYALPVNRSTQGLFYNKDLFREVGLDPEKPPESWEELREYAATLTDPSKQQYGTYAHLISWFFDPLVMEWGGRLNDDECNATFHKEGGVEAMEFVQDMLHEDGYAVLPAVMSGPFDQQVIEFINGQVGMMRHSTAIQRFIGDLVDFEWGFAMWPAGPAGRVVSHGGKNIAISAKASPEEKAAAWKFVHFLTSTEQSALFHMASGYMPTRYSVMDLPEVKAFHAEHPSYLFSVEQLEFAKPTSCINFNVPEYSSIILESTDRIIVANEDAATVLAEAAAQLQSAVDALRAEGKLVLD